MDSLGKNKRQETELQEHCTECLHGVIFENWRMKGYLKNLRTVMLYGIRCGCRFDILQFKMPGILRKRGTADADAAAIKSSIRNLHKI